MVWVELSHSNTVSTIAHYHFSNDEQMIHSLPYVVKGKQAVDLLNTDFLFI